MECVRKKPQIDEKEARESELIEKERRIHEVEEKCTTVRLETGLTQFTLGYVMLGSHVLNLEAKMVDLSSMSLYCCIQDILLKTDRFLIIYRE